MMIAISKSYRSAESQLTHLGTLPPAHAPQFDVEEHGDGRSLARGQSGIQQTLRRVVPFVDQHLEATRAGQIGDFEQVWNGMRDDERERERERERHR